MIVRAAPPPIAWVESPLQMIGAAEWAHTHEIDVPVAGRLTAQMSETADELRARGVRFGQMDPYLGIPWGLLARHRHWLVGDGFSGQYRLAASVLRPRSVTFLDDGADAVPFVDALIGHGPYARPGVAERGPTTMLAPFAREHVLGRARAGGVEIFTAFAAGDERERRVRELGVRVRRHGFAWTRATGRPLDLAEHRVVLGSARVADGRMPAEPYLRWLRAEAALGPVVYLPHRRETDAQLGQIAAVVGVRVHRLELPVELVLAGTRERLEVVSLSSSALVTLAHVLDGSPATITERRMRGSDVEVVG